MRKVLGIPVYKIPVIRDIYYAQFVKSIWLGKLLITIDKGLHRPKGARLISVDWNPK